MNTDIFMLQTHITVLKGDKPYLKEYRVVDNVVNKGNVNTAYHHDYITHTINNIDELYTIIKETSTTDNSFIIRGKSDYKQDWDRVRQIKNDDNQNGTFYDAPTAWVCVDFDGEVIPPEIERLSPESIEWLIKYRLPKEFHNSSYIYQWSSSAGLYYNNKPIKPGVNVHLFFYLDKGLLEYELNGWLPKSNGFDESVHRVVQPIFVNPNCIKDEAIVDVIPVSEKMGIVKKDDAAVKTPDEYILNELKIKKDKAASLSGTINIDSADIIIQKLNQIGCIVSRSPSTLSLKSPNENTQGGYFCKLSNPMWIGHGGKTARRVDTWLKEEWNVDFELPQLHDDALVNQLKRLKNKQNITQINSISKNNKKGKKPVSTVMDDAWDFGATEQLYVEPFNREKRHQLQERGYKHWKTLSKNISLLLYGFEGFGKSRIVNIIRADNRQVIMGCSSNNQATEQYNRFVTEGFKTQLITGRGYNLEQLGYAIVLDEPKHPWDSGQINESKTKTLMMEKFMVTQEDADRIWEETVSIDPDFEEYDVVVTTHSRLLSLGRRQASTWSNPRGFIVEDSKRIIPNDVRVILDDCNNNDFMWLSDFNNDYANVKVDGRLLEQKTIGNRHYFVRPVGFRYGYGLDSRLIFTTTEIITSYLINRAFDVYTPELMPNIKMLAGDIKLLKTNMTSHNRDGLLLPIFQRVRKEGFDFEVIADGLGMELNHSNNKGQNKFQDTDIVVEISQNPITNTRILQDELEWEDSDNFNIKVLVALDKLHQAIGRNSGYRWADKPENERKSVVVLCDAQLTPSIMSLTRYHINYYEDLDCVDYSSYRKRERDDLGGCIAWYIQNFHHYLTKGVKGATGTRAFVADCKDAIGNNIKYSGRRLGRIAKALIHLYDSKITNDYKNSIKLTMDSIGVEIQ